ncbi:Rpn family recombination-promoting nuclease/putative transposase [Sorangium sp. So ce388]|uniref:Rpn family recombination-promoting nuclease/putative transposase n=1 Tax=Sorangium sp. So ce388 TaxID=3133309 RepID=UPI003F5BB539
MLALVDGLRNARQRRAPPAPGSITRRARSNFAPAAAAPAIPPVVLHHSETGWSAAIAFQELIDLPPGTLALIAEHVPHFRFVLDDIRAEADEALRARGR